MTDKEKIVDEYITITKKEYYRLNKSERKLNALEDYGVDNWEGFREAMQSLYDGE